MKKIFFYVSFLIIGITYSQNVSFKKELYSWPSIAPSQTKQTDKFIDEDLVIIDEDVKLNLVTRTIQVLNKNCILKINTEKGLKKIKSISLPESFDIGADKYLEQQGRQKNTQAPFIYDFKIMHFAARVLKKNGEVVELPMNVKYNKVFWLEQNGNRMEDYNYIFSLENIEVGDVVEYNYTIQFAGRYGYNLFFFNGDIAKQNSSFQIKYSPILRFENQKILFGGNGADSALTKSVEVGKINTVWTYDYKFKDLKAINYPVNSCSGKNLPYIFADLNFLTFIGFSAIPNDALVFKDRGPNFEWLPLQNLFVEKANYDKQHANVRKFLSAIPNDENNADKSVFLSKLCDTLNTLKYASAESMNYSENAQYSVGSGEWLVKGKIIEEFMFELYWQLLNESKLPKNLICVQDKRLGEHKTGSRTAYKYEYNLFGIDNGKSILYIMPRVNGMKYNLDEIPFYIEGATAAVMNYDVQEVIFKSLISPKVIQFIKTSSSSENENVRTENGMFKFNLDSNVVNVSMKENLSGQFSTIVRPIYLNEALDSTVNPVYFKRCTDKPNAQNINIKKTSSSNIFPFKNSFVCTEKINFSKSSEIPLKNWFSFTFDKHLIPEKPNFDYYFDFQYTDIYNYMIEFNKASDISNIDDFTKSIHNSYFDLSSKLTKQTEATYLLSVMVKVKEPLLSEADGQLLLDFVSDLDALNNMTIKIRE